MSGNGVSNPPKVFISYRWSSPEHQEWVLAFATGLRQNGVDVRLDKWHLSEGQDTLAFMEGMVSDPDLKKVLLICDRGYVERANQREGGVGTEAQIISAQVYGSTDQNKFAAAVVELDQDGRPFLPHYMTTRLYFDMSSPEAESANFEKILRWIFDKPFHTPPPIGAAPAFLDQTHASMAFSPLSSSRLRLSHGSSDGVAAASQVLEDTIANAPSLILKLIDVPERDEAVYSAIQATSLAAEDVYRALQELVRSGYSGATDKVHTFFEGLLRLWDFSPLNTQYTRWDNDVLKFFAHDAFVSFVGICMQEREFDFAAQVLSMPFYKPRSHDRTGEAARYIEFRPYVESLDARNQRLRLNRISLHADLISERHQNSLVRFDSFLEADITLYVRGLLSPNLGWYPVSSVYLGDTYGSLPTFVRAMSERFYNRLSPLLLGLSADKLREQLTSAIQESRGLRFDYRDIAVARLINLDQLGTAA